MNTLWAAAGEGFVWALVVVAADKVIESLLLGPLAWKPVAEWPPYSDHVQ
jgi:hypothetical protein